MTVQASAGGTLFIGPANTTAASQSDYEALSFTEIGDIENLPEFGDTYQIVTFTPVNGDRRTQKFMGALDAGDPSFQIGRNLSDAGQTALIAARDDADGEYAFKLTLSDAPSGSPSQPTTKYFRAKVASFRLNPGNVNSVVMATVQLAITSAEVTVDQVA